MEDLYLDKFERVVDLLRVTGGYTAVLDSATIYTVVSDVETFLSVKDYLKLEAVPVRVVEIVDDKTFKVDTLSQVIVLAGIWKAMAPYSDYGTRKTINAKLLEKNGYEFKYQKYPLIALSMPAFIDHGQISTWRAIILIATFTSKQQKPQERVANTFKPILYPLMKRFIEMCKKSGEFIMYNADYTQIDRMFYGTEAGEQNIANVFDDPLDAVEIRDLELKFIEENCITT